MNFMTIGKVGTYLRQKNLSFAANYKIRTGQRVTDSNGNLNFVQSSTFHQVTASTKKTNSEIKTARLAAIKAKLMSGKKLSNEEMAYLRENDSELYKKAKHADEKREELKSELKGAKSKKEARQILARAMAEASAEATAELAACKSGGAISGVAMAGASPVGEISMPMENFSANVSASMENFSANVSTTTENSRQGIFEKFVMTVRALQDEYVKFTQTKTYKELPEDFFDEEDVYAVTKPNPKVLSAVSNYRRAAQKNASLNF